MSSAGLSLKSIPLFANIPDAAADELLAAFERAQVDAGQIVFTQGSVADRLLLLAEGEIEVRADSERISFLPFAPVGELGALAGLRRATTAVAAKPSLLLAISREGLFAFFRAHGANLYLIDPASRLRG